MRAESLRLVALSLEAARDATRDTAPFAAFVAIRAFPITVDFAGVFLADVFVARFAEVFFAVVLVAIVFLLCLLALQRRCRNS